MFGGGTNMGDHRAWEKDDKCNDVMKIQTPKLT
jgi:hypothetical protein